MLETIRIDKLVHGGQGMGVLADGRKVFVWNALPNELVEVRITKKRKDYAEGIAENILEVSEDRVTPLDEAYMSTSPWQILSFDAENKYKQAILEETMQREKVDWQKSIAMHSDGTEFHYRNKMEYSFWADDDGLHLALFNRGTHAKRIVKGSSIARPEIDETAKKIITVLNDQKIRGSQLKTVIIRCNQAGETVAALFVKDEAFQKIKEFESVAKGIEVCYSTAKSPASVLTKKLYSYGDVMLTDMVLESSVIYDVYSFFQVNVPVFEYAVKQMRSFLGRAQKVDLYCGVGTIGLALGDTEKFVDIDENNYKYAVQNVGSNEKVVCTSSEKAQEYVTSERALVLDPPRAGLHPALIDRINEVKPKVIAYLSCNPSTQARDLALLQTDYKIKALEGYNFFPRTPHIECLAILTKVV